jgi:hypothetical protein
VIKILVMQAYSRVPFAHCSCQRGEINTDDINVLLHPQRQYDYLMAQQFDSTKRYREALVADGDGRVRRSLRVD